MDRAELIDLLNAHGLFRGHWTLDDVAYATISANFVCEAFAAWLAQLPPELIVGHDIGGGKSITAVRWETESGDCDNIARDFGAFLSRCMWVDAVRTGRPRGNIAAGKFNFTSSRGPHAVNWFVDHDGRAHVFDAATEQLDHLTPSELATIQAGEST
jgi:hypothetical protein